MDKKFLNSLSPFWFVTDELGVVLDCSDYFDRKMELNKPFTEYLTASRVYIKDESQPLLSLENKILRLTHKNEPPFRANLHRMNEQGYFIMWPMLSDLAEVKKFNLKKEMTHPCALVADIIISRDMYQKNLQKLQEIERKKINREKFEEFSDIVSSTPSTFQIFNQDGKIIYTNEQGLDLLGITSLERASKMRIQDFITVEFKDEFDQYHQSVLEGNKHTYRYQIKDLHDQVYWIESYSAPYKLSDGNKAHVAISNDITDKIQQEAELIEQKELSFQAAKLTSLGQLAAGIGHEINNPLAVMKGHLQILNKKTVESNQRQKSINEINESLDRVVEIVKTLQTFSKLDAGRFEGVDISDALNESIELIQNINDKILIEKNIESGILVKGVRGNLQQVFINLLTNAKESMQNNSGKITISLDLQKEKVQLRIKDEGCGIPPENMSRIFEPFYSTKSVNEGAGIGLALSHQVMKDHGGDIIVESSNDRGTCFLISLDAYQFENSDEEVSLKSSKQSKRILVVDDEESIREVIEIILSEYGHHVICAENGQEALEILKREKDSIDILLSDIQMPVMNGVELLKKIKADDELNPYIIVISGGINLNIDFGENSLDNYIDDFITKPFDEVELIEIINKT